MKLIDDVGVMLAAALGVARVVAQPKPKVDDSDRAGA